MGLVKFNQQTLNIENVPDGHVILPESEVVSLRSQQNEFLRIKSFIPPGVEVSQIATLVDKGSRYDALAQERQGLTTKLTEAEQRLTGFANIPKEFTPERWNKYVESEQKSIRAEKIKAVEAKVYARIKEEDHIDLTGKIDPRFLDSAKLNALNVDDPHAADDLYGIMKSGFESQLNFIKDNAQLMGAQGGEQVGATPGGQTPAGVPSPKSGDVVSDSQLHVAPFGRS